MVGVTEFQEKYKILTHPPSPALLPEHIVFCIWFVVAEPAKRAEPARKLLDLFVRIQGFEVYDTVVRRATVFY